MKPLLKLCADGKEYNRKSATDILANEFNLTEEDLSKRYEKTKSPVFFGRIHWAKYYLQRAGLLESRNRGLFNISKLGLETLSKNPEKIDKEFLTNFKGYRDWVKASNKPSENQNSNEIDTNKERTPVELIEESYNTLKQTLKYELLEIIQKQSPAFFEQLVVDLMLSLGYGDSDTSGEVLGKTSDGGIDGVIKQDKLGLDMIYLQAKRWENKVGAPQIRDFVGSLVGKQASKGVFITTSSYTKEAIEFASNVQHTVVLIDGDKLADLMIEHNVGVSKESVFEIKRLDIDYFEEN